MTETLNPILSVGHSTHELEHFIKLLTLNGVTTIADVSRHRARSAKMNETNDTDNITPVTLFTIGFAGKTAQDFFGKLHVSQDGFHTRLQILQLRLSPQVP